MIIKYLQTILSAIAIVFMKLVISIKLVNFPLQARTVLERAKRMMFAPLAHAKRMMLQLTDIKLMR